MTLRIFKKYWQHYTVHVGHKTYAFFSEAAAHGFVSDAMKSGSPVWVEDWNGKELMRFTPEEETS